MAHPEDQAAESWETLLAGAGVLAAVWAAVVIGIREPPVGEETPRAHAPVGTVATPDR